MNDEQDQAQQKSNDIGVYKSQKPNWHSKDAEYEEDRNSRKKSDISGNYDRRRAPYHDPGQGSRIPARNDSSIIFIN